MLPLFTPLLPDFLELEQDVYKDQLKKPEDFIALYRLLHLLSVYLPVWTTISFSM